MTSSARVPGDAWEEHWSRYAESAQRNPAQEYRRKLILARLMEHPVNRVLDVGCGQGDLAAELLHELPNAEVVGVELSETGVAIASKKVPGARFHRLDLLQAVELPSGLEGWADAAVCSEVLEHVDEPMTLLQNAARLMRPGCRIVVTVPAGPRSAYDRHIGHRRHFTPDLLRTTMEQAGFGNVVVDAAGWPFFNLYKLAVIARGERLIADASHPPEDSGLLAKSVSAAFRGLFRLNATKTAWGWQLVATASLAG